MAADRKARSNFASFFLALGAAILLAGAVAAAVLMVTASQVAH